MNIAELSNTQAIFVHHDPGKIDASVARRIPDTVPIEQC